MRREISRHSIANFHPGGAISHSSDPILPTLRALLKFDDPSSSVGYFENLHPLPK
jgi:hypothetical protein